MRSADTEVVFPDMELLSLLANLPELAMAHLVSHERVALIVATGRDRYVQLLLTERHDVVVECVSNRYLSGDEELSLDEELLLLQLGFEPAESDTEPHPNFWWHAAGHADVMQACALAARTLREVFGLERDSPVTLIERHLTSTVDRHPS
jgi:hypothetical protein